MKDSVLFLILLCLGFIACQHSPASELDKVKKGMTISEAIKIFNLDTNQLIGFDEPPKIYKGIIIPNENEEDIYLLIESTPSDILKNFLPSGEQKTKDKRIKERPIYSQLKDKKIIGIASRSSNGELKELKFE
ncbi:MAG: hypothetical protein HRT71_04970 [Flavobacteriales bacterium]|nr:hypothetical protein [Flavobacteriales bacterium]